MCDNETYAIREWISITKERHVVWYVPVFVSGRGKTRERTFKVRGYRRNLQICESDSTGWTRMGKSFGGQDPLGFSGLFQYQMKKNKTIQEAKRKVRLFL